MSFEHQYSIILPLDHPSSSIHQCINFPSIESSFISDRPGTTSHNQSITSTHPLTHPLLDPKKHHQKPNRLTCPLDIAFAAHSNLLFHTPRHKEVNLVIYISLDICKAVRSISRAQRTPSPDPQESSPNIHRYTSNPLSIHMYTCVGARRQIPYARGKSRSNRLSSARLSTMRMIFPTIRTLLVPFASSCLIHSFIPSFIGRLIDGWIYDIGIHACYYNAKYLPLATN